MGGQRGESQRGPNPTGDVLGGSPRPWLVVTPLGQGMRAAAVVKDVSHGGTGGAGWGQATEKDPDPHLCHPCPPSMSRCRPPGRCGAEPGLVASREGDSLPFARQGKRYSQGQRFHCQVLLPGKAPGTLCTLHGIAPVTQTSLSSGHRGM